MNDEEKRLLGIRAATAFPDLFPKGTHDSFPSNRDYKCGKCGATWPQTGNDPLTIDKWKCTVPDPIEINGDNATMLFREAFTSMSIATADALLKVYMSEDCDLHQLDCDDKARGTNAILWALVHAEPKHLIEIACTAKEGVE